MELRGWLTPLRAELGQGWVLAWVRGLGGLPEARLRRLFLAIGRALGPVDTTYGELYPVTDTGRHLHAHRQFPALDPSALGGPGLLRQAPEGGGSRLASAVAVHDHLAERDPETLRRLHRWFYRDLVTPSGQRDRPQRLANRFPIDQQVADGPTLRYMRHWIETGHARLGKPLAPEDLGAFDRLDATLNDPRFRLALRLAPGDLLFCDNHKLAHDREAYRDDPAAPRLLLRLWLWLNASAPGLPPDGGPPRPS